MSAEIKKWVDDAIATTPIVDLHTHLYPPSFGPLILWGIDELLTYHYLIAEVFRVCDVDEEQFWVKPKSAQADLIWRELFVERPPISEACRGVVTALSRLGLEPSSKDLSDFRDYFRSQNADEHLDRVLKLANVRTVVMTNNPFDEQERDIWLRNPPRDERFKSVLRIDLMLTSYQSSDDLRKFLNEWIDRMQAIYVAASLPPAWRYPDETTATRVLREVVLPMTRERGMPFAMMIGATRQVNPRLRLAGDSLGKADIQSLERILAEHPQNKFMVTMLSRENQHELAVTARKFRNLLIFGCWWFLNVPSMIEEITRMRIELLGTSFVPQHSDCRVLEQLIYKWDHSRAVIAEVLNEKFTDLAAAGWNVTEAEVRKTVEGFLAGNFEDFSRL